MRDTVAQVEPLVRAREPVSSGPETESAWLSSWFHQKTRWLPRWQTPREAGYGHDNCQSTSPVLQRKAASLCGRAEPGPNDDPHLLRNIFEVPIRLSPRRLPPRHSALSVSGIHRSMPEWLALWFCQSMQC